MRKRTIHVKIGSFSRILGPIGIVAALFSFAGLSQAASIPELLEKGVYAEETKGDLDSAIQIYQQIVSDAKTGQALAAEAQYRLGQCFHKKKNYTAAATAFERLIKDFPDQKDLVAKARQYLPGDLTLADIPWRSGEQLQLVVKLASGFKIGTTAHSADEVEIGGKKVWRLGTRTFAGVQSASRVIADGESFRPLSSRWKHTLFGDVEATYKPGKVELRNVAKSETKTIDVEGNVFDNEQAVQLMRRLPLEVGYKAALSVVSTLSGALTVPIRLEVTSKETVQVEAGTFECFKVELNIKQTFWYSADEHRYLVKFEAGGATAELTKVRQKIPGEKIIFEDTAPKISLEAPSDWLFFKFERENNSSEVFIAILDPDAMAISGVKIVNIDDLRAQERKSMRAWAESNLEREGKQYKDFKIRPESWADRTIDGHPAISAIADCISGEKNQIIYGVFAFAGEKSIRFSAEVESEAFDGFRQVFDTIVAKCRLH